MVAESERIGICFWDESGSSQDKLTSLTESAYSNFAHAVGWLAPIGNLGVIE